MIYLDYAAATPVNKKALEAMEPYFTEHFFNPSSPYLPAKRVRADYEDAKATIARCIGAKGTDLIMTSGATESINLAFTVLDKYDEDNRYFRDRSEVTTEKERRSPVTTGRADACLEKPIILILATEHASVRETAKQFNYQEIKVKKDGRIDLDDFRQKLTHNIQLVSVSLANNELGTIQPLAEISQIIREERLKRLKDSNKTPIYLHSDASQALNLLDINVSRLGVDLLTLNAAKVGGPKGVGALYVGHGIKLQPITRGGGQERGLRSGTENVPGAIGFAVALKEAKSHLASNRKKYQEFSKIFLAEIEKKLSETVSEPAGEKEAARPREDGWRERRVSESFFSISAKHKLGNFITLVFPGLDAERLIYKLENEEIYVSTGAACAANKGQKSHVLTAIGLSDEEIAGSIRITFGTDNTKEQIIKAAKIISETVEKENFRLAKKA